MPRKKTVVNWGQNLGSRSGSTSKPGQAGAGRSSESDWVYVKGYGKWIWGWKQVWA
ncbi:hypothetical protein L195_g008317 [Trifolium pratense]|uniref:Uncharacterized protein n=1 Tax=Trifolium pratense TaxID=57577 RepID=A0A2K3P8U0_TRIPR|nr:hypothetical protein L195_g008317 [Trifolium pratense]